MREELAETIHLNETLGAPSARAMEKLFAAIDADGAFKRKPGFAFDLRTKVSEFFSAFAPRTLAYASGAAALVILLQAGVIGGMALNSGNRGEFGVASIDVKVERVGLLRELRDLERDHRPAQRLSCAPNKGKIAPTARRAARLTRSASTRTASPRTRSRACARSWMRTASWSAPSLEVGN